jgi:hypothetical protein
MFNDILTGKASLEEPKPAAPPGDAIVIARPPPPVYVDVTSSREYREQERQRERAAATHKILGVVAAVVIAVSVAAFEYGMNKQYEEDMETARGGRDRAVYGHSYDPFVDAVRGYADEMCACQDKACSWRVQGTFDHYVRTTPAPQDEDDLNAAAAETFRYTECMENLHAKL